jgi:hypothetical protein
MIIRSNGGPGDQRNPTRCVDDAQGNHACFEFFNSFISHHITPANPAGRARRETALVLVEPARPDSTALPLAAG